jgi:predicted TIM-barrel fold metal-dependent hydrolase
MSAAASTVIDMPIPDGLRRTFVLDLDVHVHETPAALAPYCEQPWREALNTIAKLPARYLDIPGFAPTVSPFPIFPTTERKHEVREAGELRADLDRLAVDAALLFPDALLLHASLRPAEYAIAVAQAYNRWLVEQWLDSSKRGLLGAIIAPHHDPLAGAAEVRRYADHPRVRAVYLPCTAVDPLYGARWYDPLFEAAQECDLAVVLHAVGTLHPIFPFNLQAFDTTFGQHTLVHGLAMIANLVHMIESGVPVRFPNLRVAFTEAGVAWVPWIAMRMDKEYVERRRDVPFLRERPSHYVKRMWFATQPIEEPEDPGHMTRLLALFDGEDNVAFASDWPHHDFDHPRKVWQLPIAHEAKAKIMGANALRLLGLSERPG